MNFLIYCNDFLFFLFLILKISYDFVGLSFRESNFTERCKLFFGHLNLGMPRMFFPSKRYTFRVTMVIALDFSLNGSKKPDIY